MTSGKLDGAKLILSGPTGARPVCHIDQTIDVTAIYRTFRLFLAALATPWQRVGEMDFIHIQRHPGMIPTAMSIRPQSSSGRWRGLDFDQRIDRAGKTGRVGCRVGRKPSTRWTIRIPHPYSAPFKNLVGGTGGRHQDGVRPKSVPCTLIPQ